MMVSMSIGGKPVLGALIEDYLTAPDRRSVMMLYPDDEKRFVAEEKKD
jgi:hypothetical protein